MDTKTLPNNNSGIKQPAKRGRGRGLTNVLLIIAIVAVIGAFAWAEQQRRTTQSELKKTLTELEELRQASQRTGQQVADEVLTKVRAHMIIDDEPVPTVATIVDIEKLKEANEFYRIASNGDHLIITDKRAILYDPGQDKILDVVPVRINGPQTSTAPSPATINRTTPTATP